jgi:hypothetical protein
VAAWPALTLACGFSLGPDGRARVPSKTQQSKRQRVAGASSGDLLLALLVRAGLWMGLTGGGDLILGSAPIRAWRRSGPDAAVGYAHHSRALPRG